MLRVVLLVLCSVCLHGCYYVQAAKGQWELTRTREPLAEVIADEATSPALAARLRLVQEARQFAIDELALPDNDTYRTYADIERQFVVWNVFATPEFSLQPETWCFPVAGCVSYRGYFRKADAEREAQRLAARGFDVAVGGVAAYSTLGRFKDPVLSSMLQWDDVQLVAVLFHELAHQVLYVKGETGFNESFATAVEEHGVERWLAARGLQDQYAAYLARREVRAHIIGLAEVARADLEAVYAGTAAVEDKRRAKKDRLATLQRDIIVHLEQAGHDPGGWAAGEMNNARLVPMLLYTGRLPEFRALLRSCAGDMPCFYAKARLLAGREADISSRGDHR
jgi:predicted aminopeptidase